jgi:hypothetical protein
LGPKTIWNGAAHQMQKTHDIQHGAHCFSHLKNLLSPVAIPIHSRIFPIAPHVQQRRSDSAPSCARSPASSPRRVFTRRSCCTRRRHRGVRRRSQRGVHQHGGRPPHARPRPPACAPSSWAVLLARRPPRGRSSSHTILTDVLAAGGRASGGPAAGRRASGGGRAPGERRAGHASDGVASSRIHRGERIR